MNEYLKNCLVSNEFIASQSDLAFKDSIAGVIRDLRHKPRFRNKDVTDSPLSQLVKRRTGMNVKFNINIGIEFNASAHFNFTKVESVLLPYYKPVLIGASKRHAKRIYGDIRNNLQRLESSVNFKNSTVSGFFSEQENYVYIGHGFIKKNTFTPEEVTAIVLHELGHLFCNYMYTIEFARTNMVLSSLNRLDYFNSDKDRKIQILEDLESISNVKINEKRGLSDLNEDLTYPVLIKDVFERPRSEFNNKTFDFRLFEFISDQFATMHGAGGDLAAALFKMNKTLTVKKHYWTLNQIFVLINIFILPIFTPLSAGNKLLTIVGNLIKVLIFQTLQPDSLYDDDDVRIRKIKEQLIGLLKNRDLDEDRKRMIIKEIKAIDVLLDKTHAPTDLTNLIYKAILPWARKNQRIVKLQHDYETIVNNQFILQAAKMETI